jgi:hypothetical protein
MALSRDTLLSGQERWPRSEVDLRPELDGSVWVRTLSLAQMERVRAAQKGMEPDSMLFIAALVAECVCDEAGAPLFDSGDVTGVSAVPFLALQKISAAAMEVNGMGEGFAEAARKKSPTPPSA